MTNPSVAYQRLIDALQQHGSKVRGNDTQASAQCPAHDDHDPSLKVTSAPESVLIHCHVGCDTNDVLAALGLSLRDLYDEPHARTPHRRARPRPTTNAWLNGKAVPVSVDRIADRADQQARIEATPDYWRRRADDLDQVGTPTATNAAVACRHHAALLAQEVSTR